MSDALQATEIVGERYAVEREIGRGGMAIVYRAMDLRYDRLVALKVLRADLSASLSAERFLREIRITAGLQHPHILSLLDSGEWNGRLYYVMPFVEGESLNARLFREKMLPLEDALRITRGAGAALAFANAHGVVHRDVKPGNILLHEGEAMIADFGVALAVSTAAPALTETGVILGTPLYMSPEQCAGEPLDARSDQYSLATVLFEMLAGEPPYGGPSMQSIVAKQMTAPVPRIGTLRPVPQPIDDAVARALSKSPADRYPDMGAFVAALEARGSRHGLLHRGMTRAAGVLAGAMLVAAALVAWRLSTLERRTPTLQRQFTFTGRAKSPALSPDGASVAYVFGGRSLVVQPVNGGEPTVLVPPGRFVWSARWTRDGSQLVVSMMPDSSELAATYLVPSHGGTPRKVLDDWPPFDTGADSTVVVRAPRERHVIEFASLTTGRTMRTLALPDSVGEVQEVAWSPDGRWIALCSSGSRVWVLSASGGPTRLASTNGRSVRWGPESDVLYFLSGPPGGVDLMRTAVDQNTGIPRAATGVRVMSLPTADAIDIAGSKGNRVLVYTQANPSAQVLALTFGNTPRRVTRSLALTEGTAQVHTAAISDDGRWVAFGEARGPDIDLHVMPFDGGPASVVASTPAVEDSPAWSPDGGRLSFFREDSVRRDMMVVDLRSGSQQRVGTVPGPGLSGEELFIPLLGRGRAAWSADGRHLAYYARDLTRISLVDLARQKETIMRVPDSVGTGYFFIVPSPDGGALIASTIARWNDWGELWLVTVDGQHWRRLHGPFGESFPISWGADGWIYLLNNRAYSTDYGPIRLEIWRMHGPDGPPELFSTLPDGCGVATGLSADHRRGVCNYVRYESDLYVSIGFDANAR